MVSIMSWATWTGILTLIFGIVTAVFTFTDSMIIVQLTNGYNVTLLDIFCVMILYERFSDFVTSLRD